LVVLLTIAFMQQTFIWNMQRLSVSFLYIISHTFVPSQLITLFRYIITGYNFVTHSFHLLSASGSQDTVVPECFKDDNASQWKSGKFDPRSLRNSWTDRHLNLHGWLRRGPLPLCKFHHDTITPLCPPPNMRKWQVTQLVFWFFRQPTTKTPAPIFAISTSNDVVSRKDVCLLGSPKQNYTFRPHFPPKTQIFSQFLTVFRKFRGEKALIMGMLICKLPLIVIVAPWKLYSE